MCKFKSQQQEQPSSYQMANAAKFHPRRDLFRFIRNTMLVAAMCPLRLTDYFPKYLYYLAIFLELLFEVFLYFVTIHIWILYLLTLYLYYQEGDLEFLVNCLIQAIIYFWTIAMKLYFRRMQPTKLKHLMDFINLKYVTCSANGFTYVTMNESLSMSNKWIKIYVYCCFIGTIFWLILPIAYGDHSLPLRCWYPFDYKEPLIYETMYFFQAIGQLQVAAAFSASSGFHMVLAILISGQYDILYCSLKNVMATAYINLGASRSELKKLSESQVIADKEPSQYYCSVELQNNEILNTTFTTTGTAENFYSAFRAAFKSCVQHHRYIIKALQKMEYFYNPIWFLKTGEVIFLMCLVAFVSVKSTTANSSFMKIVSLGQYLLLVAWEMLIICYFGEIIYLNSQRCGEALLRSPWYLHLREMKMDFLLFLLNSQRTFKLTAGKIYVLNVDRFRGFSLGFFL
ncbi:odorant receptor 83a [Teleopsis dalmanni]|uniref:odorant receptor 83a n=1 Tax=Teleopsis dalmanni TaxID=139649 RepID=UPI0018CD684F|nr:odorant receptor 83a [Teleopsis dalmanni]